MPSFVYKSEPVRGAIWQRMFAEQLPDLPFHVWPDSGDKADVIYLGAWTLPDDLYEFTNLEVLFSVAAGVDQLDIARIPAHVTLVRMLEPGLTAGMVEYATMAVLALHRGIPAFLENQRSRVWSRAEPSPRDEPGRRHGPRRARLCGAVRIGAVRLPAAGLGAQSARCAGGDVLRR